MKSKLSFCPLPVHLFISLIAPPRGHKLAEGDCFAFVIIGIPRFYKTRDCRADSPRSSFCVDNYFSVLNEGADFAQRRRGVVNYRVGYLILDLPSDIVSQIARSAHTALGH